MKFFFLLLRAHGILHRTTKIHFLILRMPLFLTKYFNLYFLLSCFLNIRSVLALSLLCTEKKHILLPMKAKDPISLDWPTALLFSFFFLCSPLFFACKSNRNHVGGILDF
jgi:hypothetical protein